MQCGIGLTLCCFKSEVELIQKGIFKYGSMDGPLNVNQKKFLKVSFSVNKDFSYVSFRQSDHMYSEDFKFSA